MYLPLNSGYYDCVTLVGAASAVWLVKKTACRRP